MRPGQLTLRRWNETRTWTNNDMKEICKHPRKHRGIRSGCILQRSYCQCHYHSFAEVEWNHDTFGSCQLFSGNPRPILDHLPRLQNPHRKCAIQWSSGAVVCSVLKIVEGYDMSTPSALNLSTLPRLGYAICLWTANIARRPNFPSKPHRISTRHVLSRHSSRSAQQNRGIPYPECNSL